METHFALRSRLAMLVIGMAAAMLAAASAVAAESGSPFPFSADPAVSAQQHAAYDVVQRYEQLLNAGDTAGILDLFASESVAEWNDKPTFATRQEKADAYNALFKVAKFSTVFGYAGIDVSGDTAVVRTYHHKGATVLEGGKEVVDLNREVFVLRKKPGGWKIILYIFNTDPVQGEG
jgi:ketosteroid isomerase-like protein